MILKRIKKALLFWLVAAQKALLEHWFAGSG